MQEVSTSRVAICFGVYEVDLSSGELRKQGVKLRLQEQPFQILQALLERPGEVVTREQLRQRIWPADTFVDFDHGVYNAIKRLRETLGDSADAPRYIETLPKRGYRFVADIERRGNNSHHPVAVLPADESSNGDPKTGGYGRSQELRASAGTKQRSFRVQEIFRLLNQYPRWVRLAAALAVVAAAALVAVLIFRAGHQTGMDDRGRPAVVARPTESDKSDHPPAFQVSGTGGPLEVTEVRFTDEGEFDVMVRNLGDTDLIIHRISIKKLQEPGGIVLKKMEPTAKYDIPVDDIPVGKTKGVSVSHVVPPHQADRFLIGLDSDTIYLLEVTLYYNRGQKASFTMETWNSSE